MKLIGDRWVDRRYFVFGEGLEDPVSIKANGSAYLEDRYLPRFDHVADGPFGYADQIGGLFTGKQGV